MLHTVGCWTPEFPLWGLIKYLYLMTDTKEIKVKVKKKVALSV